MRISAHVGIFLLILIIFSCQKDQPPPQPTDFTVTNSWECTIDGIPYAGSIDTSFAEYLSRGYGAIDSVIYCTGTSGDKKANIHFRMTIDRFASRVDTVHTQFSDSEFDFDTSSANRLRAWANLGDVSVGIEGLNGTKFKGSFRGTAVAILGGGARTVTNGKFSFDIGKGNNEPKFLSCQADNTPIRGYVSSANLISNTLILDGLGFYADSTFQLMIRMGSQLKTGVFQSRGGDVGFQAYRPSIVTHFVSDTIGNLKVTITSVSGNIVEGTFSGASQGSSTGSQVNITSGKFKCRVRNYVSQQDSINKWGFSESNDLQYPYHTWGGNIIEAKQFQNGIWYYVLLNGESDNGKSKFTLKLSSTSPISPGIYKTGYNVNNVDSIYFNCSPMGFIYYQRSDESFACQIDTISSQRIVGHFYGKVNFATDPNSALIYQPSLRRGYFRANF
jgi:hypothetical protein